MTRPRFATTPTNRLGERSTVSVPDSADLGIDDYEVPSAVFTIPNGDVVDLADDVRFHPAEPGGGKEWPTPARWQVITPLFEAVGEYTLSFAGQEFKYIVTDTVNPRAQKKLRGHRTRGEAVAEQEG